MTVKRCILFVILLCHTSFPFRFKEDQLQRWALLVADDLGFWRSPPTHPQISTAEPLCSKEVIKRHGSLGALLLGHSVPLSPVDISHCPSPPLLVAQGAVSQGRAQLPAVPQLSQTSCRLRASAENTIWVPFPALHIPKQKFLSSRKQGAKYIKVPYLVIKT